MLGVEADEVLEVVMVGGSTRTPFVREQVGEFFWPHTTDQHQPRRSCGDWCGDSSGHSG
ncbi:Hsp70 family protein [Vibrio cholerae]